MRFTACVAVFVWTCFAEELSPRYEDELRMRRQINSLPLVYPFGGTYKLLVGFAVPIKADDGISLVFAINFQYQYAQFQNITELSQHYFLKTVARQERAVYMDPTERRNERLTFYRSMADLLDFKGFNGYDCVLRAICEVAQYPVEEEGLVGEIVHILLTPDYGKSPFEDWDSEWEETMSPYTDAATAGRQMFSCSSIYTGCPEGRGVLELISFLTDH